MPPQPNSLYDLVGFDYAQTIRKLNHHGLTYLQIAEAIGYESQSSIYQIMNGATPSHKHGEALWGLYRDLFGDKPPLNTEKRTV